MIKGKKIKDATDKDLAESFGKIFFLIGLRENSIPNDLETAFLFNEVREEFGNNAIEEIEVAFKKAIKRELKLDDDQIKPYGVFSFMYFSLIMSAYRVWASQQYRMIEAKLPPTEQELKLLEGPRKDFDGWGQLLEQEYQHYLSFGSERVKYFPAEMYHQLEKDDLIKSELWREAMKIVRERAIREMVGKVSVLETRKFENAEKNERVKFAQSINQTNIRTLNSDIEDYRTGKKDGEIELMAKQYCIFQYFKHCKKMMKKNIYQPA